jgi:hypothetical protein
MEKKSRLTQRRYGSSHYLALLTEADLASAGYTDAAEV